VAAKLGHSVKDPDAIHGVCFGFSKLRAWRLRLIIAFQRPSGSLTAALIVAGRFLTLHSHDWLKSSL
jgi:hypothetical protein